MCVVGVLLVVTLGIAHGGAEVGHNYGDLVDQLLKETRALIPDLVPFTELRYREKSWNSRTEQFDVLTRLRGVNGRLELGSFQRDGEPSIDGATNDQILRSKFITSLTITYDNFTADNFTSGEEDRGQMTVSYDKAEILTYISIKKTTKTCSSSLLNFLLITLSEPNVKFASASSNLPQKLFSKAKSTMNFYLNQTLMKESLPTFAGVVAGPDLCSSL